MTPNDRVPVAVIVLGCVLIVLLFVGVLLWSDEPTASAGGPMETNHYRAEGWK
jgi:hypothetical protein